MGAKASICSIDGCGHTRQKRGWCTGHAARVRRHGDPQAHIPLSPRVQNVGKLCAVAGCGRPARRLGACLAHYQRLKKTGDYQAGRPLAEREPSRILERAPDGKLKCQRCFVLKPDDRFPWRADSPGAQRRVCKDCRAEYALLWRVANVDKCKVYSDRSTHARRVALAGCDYDDDVNRTSLRRRDGDACCYCGVEMSFAASMRDSRPRNLATLEHVIPVSKGGSHTWGNCALACFQCNLSKGNRERPKWKIRRGHRLSD